MYSVSGHVNEFFGADKDSYTYLIVVENKEGSRFWLGSGKLRNEFALGGKVERRNWGMMEIKVEIVWASRCVKEA